MNKQGGLEMSFTKAFFEIGIVALTLIIVALLVIVALLPVEVFLSLIWRVGLLLLIFAGVIYLCGRSLEYTKKEYLVYFAAASLIIGFTIFLFGFFTAIVKTPMTGIDQAKDHYIISAIGLGSMAFSWLAKRLTGISCVPTVRKLMRFIYY